MSSNENKIDWSFISDREGGARAAGYIPTDRDGKVIGKSGLTIATGFDVGQMSIEELSNSGLSGDVVSLLSPYVGVTGENALKVLNSSKAPFLNAEQIAEVDRYTHAKTLGGLRRRYSNSTDGANFFDLTSRQQTVLASAAFQYGANLEEATPGFWRQVTKGNWDEAYKNLMNFGDSYSTRRQAEAAYLKGTQEQDNFSAAFGKQL